MPVTKPTLDSSVSELVSTTMYAQLRLVVYEELIPLEAQIFVALERVVYGQNGIGKQNPIAVWACLWTLIFTYKEHMVFTKPLAQMKQMSMSLNRSHIQRTRAILTNLHLEEDRYHLNRHLYNTLTSMYAALYKTTSPLTFDWRTAEISDMLGTDQQLIRLFNNIKTEMYWFRKLRCSLPRFLMADTIM